MRRGAGRCLLFLRLGSLSDHPVCVQAFGTRCMPEEKGRRHALLEVALRSVQLGAFEDRAEEQEPARAVVPLLVIRVVVLQDVVDDL